jgi:biofilm PGA synthesis lipoprotein PgaB
MKKIIALSIFCLIVFNFTNIIYANEESSLKGIQILTFECKDLEEVERVISEFKDVGINTIIVRCFQNKGDRSLIKGEVLQETGVYFKTDYAPVIGDVLGSLISIAHRYNIKIFAWMETLKSPWAVKEHPEWQSRIFDINERQIVSIDKLDLFNEEVQNYLFNLYGDLAKYPLDGILFQDDLILTHSEGFSQSALDKYKSDFREELLPTNLFVRHGFEKSFLGDIYTSKFWQWADWKAKTLLDFAATIKDAVKKVNPNIAFSLNCYYEDVLFPEKALAWFSHNLKEAQNYGFDYYFIMAYHRQMKKELALNEKRLNRMMKSLAWRLSKIIKNSSRAVIKVQTINWQTKEPIPYSEIDKIHRLLIGTKNVGLVFIPYHKDMDLELMRRYF